MTLQTPTLLLVDDHADNLFALEEVIAALIPGCRIFTATDGPAGLALAAEESPDGCLVDLRMPEMNGIAFCRQLREDPATAAIPLILLTSHTSSPLLRAQGLAAGATDFISRPIDNLELAARINCMLRIKEAEDRLRACNADLEGRTAQQTAMLRQYQMAVESSSDLIATVDSSYSLTMANAAFCRFYGRSRDQVVGRPVAEVLGTSPYQKTIKAHLERCLHGETVRYQTDHTCPPHPESCLEKHYYPLWDDEGEVCGAVVITRDITRERQVERLKNEFISTAAHELRTPLTSIMGYAELLRDLPDRGDDLAQECLGYILDKGQELEQIIGALLDLNRVGTGRPLQLKPAPCEVMEIIRQSVAQFEEETTLHTFSLELPPPPVTLNLDRWKILQVLEHLLGNAVKFSPNGGQIAVCGHITPDTFELTIRDEGIGLSAEEQEQIFQPFWRADGSNTARSGLGLGLTLAKGIVEAHHGTLRIASQPGRGTTVTLGLPTHHRPEALRGAL